MSKIRHTPNGKLTQYLSKDHTTMPADRAGKYITIFTDASYCPNTRATGWAVWIKFGELGNTYRESGGYQSKRGNQSARAELRALAIAIEVCINLDSISFNEKIVVIRSDCRWALDNLNVDNLKNLGATKVTKRWVKGHNGKGHKTSAVNTWCDEQAKARMREVRSRIQKERACKD